MCHTLHTFMVAELNQRKIKWLGENHTGNLWWSQEFPESQPTVFNYCFSSSSSAVFKVEVNPILFISVYVLIKRRSADFSLKDISKERKERKGQDKGLISCTPCTCQKLKHRASNAVCSRPHRKFVAETGNLIFIPWIPVQGFNVFLNQFIFHMICSLYHIVLEILYLFIFYSPFLSEII